MLLREYDPSQPRDEAGRWSSSLDRLNAAATLQGALDATPAKLKRAPGGHMEDYTGEDLSGPPGAGSVRALSEYEGPHYVKTNGSLRRGDLTDPVVAHRVAEIDKTMAVSGLAEDVRVERVIQRGASVFGKDAWYGDVIDFNKSFLDVEEDIEKWEVDGIRPNLTGLRWKELGYSSTTADPAVAEDFGKKWPKTNKKIEGEPVIMRILVPKGTGGVQLAELGNAAEILLQRDIELEVIGDNGVDGKGFRRLDVRVVD